VAAVQSLDERKTAILKAIVRDYVRGGEPVASKRLVDELDLGVSAATIRAEMAALEEAGYIVQPHTSAGRVPTDKGYRFFVDSLTAETPMQPGQAAAVEALFVGARDLEDLLRRASAVLSRLTRFAALVAAPRLDRSRLRHVELVQLSPRSVLAILIADTGRVEKRKLDFDTPIAEHDVARVRHVLNDAAAGLRVRDAADVVAGLSVGAPVELRPLLDRVSEAVAAGLGDEAIGDHVFVGGTANMAEPGYFDRIEQLRLVYETLEEDVTVLAMLRDALRSGDPSVRIGQELSLSELAACSVVVSSYDAGGEPVGSLGVLGPTRMDYARTLASVQAVASSLEKALTELTGEREAG
jgi:heat-inducible transcriptional repressor